MTEPTRFQLVQFKHEFGKIDDDPLDNIPAVILAALNSVPASQRVIHLTSHEFPGRLFNDMLVNIYVENIS